MSIARKEKKRRRKDQSRNFTVVKMATVEDVECWEVEVRVGLSSQHPFKISNTLKSPAKNHYQSPVMARQ
jgi:hypothetical protein